MKEEESITRGRLDVVDITFSTVACCLFLLLEILQHTKTTATTTSATITTIVAQTTAVMMTVLSSVGGVGVVWKGLRVRLMLLLLELLKWCVVVFVGRRMASGGICVCYEKYF